MTVISMNSVHTPAAPQDGVQPMVSFRDVRKSFGALEVLKGIDLDVMPGQVAALIGRSGSGKSTALRCINGLEKINGGELTVCGRNLRARDIELRELRKEDREAVPPSRQDAPLSRVSWRGPREDHGRAVRY